MNDTRDDGEAFSLKRQERTGHDLGTDKSAENSAAKSAPTDKSSSAAVDDNALPDRIRRKYYVVTNEPGKGGPEGEARLYADERGEYLAFKVTDDRLVTRLAAAEVIRDMVSVAQHRQWESLEVRGSVEFRREAWLEAGARGLARISHSVEAHRGANQRKFFCKKDFALIQGMPRCRQSVAQNGLILERWKAGLWKRPLMPAW